MSLPRGVWALGFASLLNDAASEMVVPLLPLLVTGSLGGGAVVLGIVDGAADAVAAVLKLWSGRWSDRLGRTRPFVLGGYLLSNLVRPLLALAASPAQVVVVRVADRVGKGLRTSPRDALLGALVGPEDRVRAYSLNRAMDHSGAILGALAAWALLQVGLDLRTAIFASVLPGLGVMGAVGFLVKDPPAPPRTGAAPLGELPPGLHPLLRAAGLFALGRAGDAFLLYKALESEAEPAALPLLWVALHVVKVISAGWAPSVAARLGARGTVAAGWAVYALLMLAFAVARDVSQLSALFVLYGLHHGLTEGAERALVAERVAPEARATAFGWYHLVTGLMALPAGLGIGLLWTLGGAPLALGLSAGVAALAIALLRRV